MAVIVDCCCSLSLLVVAFGCLVAYCDWLSLLVVEVGCRWCVPVLPVVVNCRDKFLLLVATVVCRSWLSLSVVGCSYATDVFRLDTPNNVSALVLEFA